MIDQDKWNEAHRREKSKQKYSLSDFAIVGLGEDNYLFRSEISSEGLYNIYGIWEHEYTGGQGKLQFILNVVHPLEWYQSPAQSSFWEPVAYLCYWCSDNGIYAGTFIIIDDDKVLHYSDDAD